MKLSNRIIYSLAEELISFSNNNDIQIPAKAIFFIQKNISNLIQKAQEIERKRIELIETGKEKEKELALFLNAEQEIYIHKINLEEIKEVKFTPLQKQKLMIMFDGEEYSSPSIKESELK